MPFILWHLSFSVLRELKSQASYKVVSDISSIPFGYIIKCYPSFNLAETRVY